MANEEHLKILKQGVEVWNNSLMTGLTMVSHSRRALMVTR